MRPILSSFLLLVAACTAADATPQAKEFSGERALARVANQLAFGPRVPGTPAQAAMAKWLDSIGHKLADTVVVQRWWHKTAKGDSIPLINVMARFKPALTDRILYLAHWDSRPRADQGNPGSTTPIAGANDGASGVAILIGVAEALKKLPPTIGVDLLFVDGEDYGYFLPNVDVLIGAAYYVDHPIASEKPRFAVLFDMVGQYNLRLPIESNSQVAAPDVIEQVWRTAEVMGYGGVFTRQNGGEVTDDHIPFITAGYKAIDLIPDIGSYPPWHTLDDTYDKISSKTLETVGNVAVAVIRRAVK